MDALADMFERHNTAGHALSQRLAEEPQNARLQKNQTESVVLLVCGSCEPNLVPVKNRCSS